MSSSYNPPGEWYGGEGGPSPTSSWYTPSPEYGSPLPLPALPPHYGHNNTIGQEAVAWTTNYSYGLSTSAPPQVYHYPPTAFEAPPSSLPTLPPLPAPLALRQPQTTVGDVLYSIPPAAVVHSPPAAQHRRLSLEDEVTTAATNCLKISPFIARLVHMLDNAAEFQDCIVWDAAGTGFVVRQTSEHLLRDVLPQFFGHGNIHSFTRQLNVYGFSRMTQGELSKRLSTSISSTEYSGWSHAHFLRADRSMIHLLTPKPSRARLQKKAEKQARLEREEQQRRKAHLISRAARMDAGGSGSSAGSVGLVGWPYVPVPPGGQPPPGWSLR